MVPSDTEPAQANHTGQQEVPMNPLRIAEMAIEIQLEKLRVAEAINARDALVYKLSDAYTSIREKTELIKRLQNALNLATNTSNNDLDKSLSSPTSQRTMEPTELQAQVAELETLMQDFRIGSKDLAYPPPKYEEEEKETLPVVNAPGSQAVPAATSPLFNDVQVFSAVSRVERSIQTPVSGTPEEMVAARFALLESIPLPINPPDDTLKPIVLPSTCTLHDFLGSVSGNLRNALGNYRMLQSVATKWCPNREEHGYFYSPLFKCNTNPRVNTAHRWQAVDVVARMKYPTECFYNRGGVWYYAGSYLAFRLEDLSVREWAELPPETSSYLVRETLSGRKNVSPQNVYEVNQLYNAGALKIACVGLQCVGFDQDIYVSLLEHATTYTQTAKQNPPPSAAGTIATTVNPNKVSSCSNLGTGTAPGNANKSGNPLVRSTYTAAAAAVPSIHLGSTKAGYGAVAAGLGFGDGGTRKVALLSQANNQTKPSPNGART